MAAGAAAAAMAAAADKTAGGAFGSDSVRAHFLEEGGRGSGLEFPPKNVYISPNTPTLVQNILGAFEERFNPTARLRACARLLLRSRLPCLLVIAVLTCALTSAFSRARGAS